MARRAPRHDRGPAELLAAKAALRQEIWSAMRVAKVARASRLVAVNAKRWDCYHAPNASR